MIAIVKTKEGHFYIGEGTLGDTVISIETPFIFSFFTQRWERVKIRGVEVECLDIPLINVDKVYWFAEELHVLLKKFKP